MAFIEKGICIKLSIYFSHSFFTQEHQPRGAAGGKSASHKDHLPAADRCRMQYSCGNREAIASAGK